MQINEYVKWEEEALKKKKINLITEKCRIVFTRY